MLAKYFYGKKDKHTYHIVFHRLGSASDLCSWFSLLRNPQRISGKIYLSICTCPYFTSLQDQLSLPDRSCCNIWYSICLPFAGVYQSTFPIMLWFFSLYACRLFSIPNAVALVFLCDWQRASSMLVIFH